MTSGPRSRIPSATQPVANGGEAHSERSAYLPITQRKRSQNEGRAFFAQGPNHTKDWMRMDTIKKALNITGILGAAFAVFGYIGLFVGGDLGEFTGGAMPGILLGFSLLVLLVVPRGTDEK